MSNNILIFGVGKTGSRLFVSILEKLGWNIGEVTPSSQENLWVQNINKQILLKSKVCPCGVVINNYPFCNRCRKDALLFQRSPLNTSFCIQELQEPWVIKDPRFVVTLYDKMWVPIWEQYQPLMIYITRDYNVLYKKYFKIWKQTNDIYGYSLKDFIYMGEQQYLKWNYNKINISFEQLIEAGKLIDFVRAIKY